MNPKKNWWILLIVSLVVIIPFMYPYLTFDTENSLVTITPNTIHFTVLVTYIIFAFIALVTGSLQFIDHIHLKKPKIHRYLGKIYIVSVWINGLQSFGVFVFVEGFTKVVTFLALTVLWLFTSWKGYHAADNYSLKGCSLPAGTDGMTEEILNVKIHGTLLPLLLNANCSKVSELFC